MGSSSRNTTISTVVVEDEMPARERLTRLISELDTIEVFAYAADGLEAVKIIGKYRPRLVFLDVQIPGINGFEVLERLRYTPAVVFTTAFDEYAIRAFEVNAVDYLLKPYSRERFHHAVDRALSTIVEYDKYLKIAADYSADHSFLQRISIRNGHVFNVIPVDQIDFFRSEDGIVFLYQGGHRHVIESTLIQLEEQLDPSSFFRVHRNSIVNLDRIIKIVPWGQGQLAISFSDGDRVFVSRRHIDEFRRRIGLQF